MEHVHLAPAMDALMHASLSSSILYSRPAPLLIAKDLGFRSMLHPD